MAAPKQPGGNLIPYLPPRMLDQPRADAAGARPSAGYLGSAEDAVAWLRALYPTDVGRGARPTIGNYLPVADRQTLTMAASQHPLPNTGPYTPPSIVAGVFNTPAKPGDFANRMPPDPGPGSTIEALAALYPDPRIRHAIGQIIANSQAIGDRSPTTMTNPLPNYRPPAMVNTPLAAQLRAMINHALAQRGLSPLINAPLPVGPTQMGAR